MIKIAFPKGRLGESVAEKFMEAGYTFEGAFDETRKLYFENEKMGVSMFWVKPFDVPVYVERGAADLGVCGNDVLLERDLHVYEIADLKRGVCRLSSACKKENASKTKTEKKRNILWRNLKTTAVFYQQDQRKNQGRQSNAD